VTRLTKLRRSIADKVALVTGAASSMGRAQPISWLMKAQKSPSLIATVKAWPRLSRGHDELYCPGAIHTTLTAPIPDKAKETFSRRRVPLKRYGEPEEVHTQP
jgi:hypothetical protein